MRVLDLDGSITSQARFLAQYRPEIVPLSDWGPRLRLACRHRSFRRFEEALSPHLDGAPAVTFVGSGDFHHVSLALVRRITTPFNLLVIDKHPDWMRGVPFLHCGTWLRHALRLPQLRRVYHVGGDLDFDNAFRLLAPWDDVRSGKVVVLPAVRTYTRGFWPRVRHQTLRAAAGEPVTPGRAADLLHPFRTGLRHWPLYVSLDKDVMTADEAAVNWDSGHLRLSEVVTLLGAFLEAAGGRCAGLDVVGDWSAVRVRGLGRRLLHRTEHPPLATDAATASQTNERTNLALLRSVAGLLPEFVPGRRAAGFIPAG